jgi:diguanylate cyclase
MELIRRQYYRFLLLFMSLLCLLCIGLSFWAIQRAESVHAAQTYRQIYAVKKVFLKDTVLNMIRDIDRFRALNRDRANEYIKRLDIDFDRLYVITPSRFEELGLELLNRPEYKNSLNVRFEDSDKHLVLYTSEQNTFSYKKSFGARILRLGINEGWVNKQTKTAIANIIHSQTFENDGYLWVNEIINWEGGDNYAIRRIHPNLIKTEGCFLSTKTKDIKGNTPYLAELEGVKKSGEIYSMYFFKRKDNDQIAEKLSYATVYRDYNWIIAMGVYLEDVQVYIDAAKEAGRTLSMQVVLFVFTLMVLFFTAGLFILSRMEQWYMQRTTHAFREEANTDSLTGALNRRMGDAYIVESFKRYHRGLDNPVFFFFDIDNFKKVNDTYGHDAGDKVLQVIVAQIRLNMRSTDHLFRWGGEEFLLMCYGVELDGAVELAGKLNQVIATTPFVIGKTDEAPTCSIDLAACKYLSCDKKDSFDHLCVNRDGDKIIHVSISIGITCFNKSDHSPETTLKRIDDALYQAKSEGKNCARLA